MIHGGYWLTLSCHTILKAVQLKGILLVGVSPSTSTSSVIRPYYQRILVSISPLPQTLNAVPEALQ